MCIRDRYVLDRATGKRVLEVPVGLSVAGVALAADGRRAWAIARDDGELVAFDAADWTETGRLSLGVGIDTLVLSPDGETLFVGNSIGGQVHAVDAETLALRTTVELSLIHIFRSHARPSGQRLLRAPRWCHHDGGQALLRRRV